MLLDSAVHSTQRIGRWKTSAMKANAESTFYAAIMNPLSQEDALSRRYPIRRPKEEKKLCTPS